MLAGLEKRIINTAFPYIIFPRQNKELFNKCIMKETVFYKIVTFLYVSIDFRIIRHTK